MTAPLRLGRIDFINVIPVHRHLAASPLFQEVRAVPSALNRMVRAGELDLAEVSSVEYARAAGQYLILPDLGLYSRGPVRSVMLLSREPMSFWQGRAVEVPFESDTSVALLLVLLSRLWGLDCRLVDEGGAEPPVAVLRIGNRALRESASGHWPLVWDLGQVWQEWTCLPFVYALWVVRRQCAAGRGDEVAQLHAALLKARDQGLADLEGCAAEAAGVLAGGREYFLEYFRGLGYGLGGKELEGLGRFYQLLAEQGLLQVRPEIDIWEPARRP